MASGGVGVVPASGEVGVGKIVVMVRDLEEAL
jgi:hypothetical protein